MPCATGSAPLIRLSSSKVMITPRTTSAHAGSEGTFRAQKKEGLPRPPPSSTHPRSQGHKHYYSSDGTLLQGRAPIMVLHQLPRQQGSFPNPSALSPSTSPLLLLFAGIDGFLEVRGNHQASHDPYPRRRRGLATNSSHPAGTDKSIHPSGSATNLLP